MKKTENMKKPGLILILFAMLLGGCQGKEGVQEYLEDFSKAQEIAVILPGEARACETITEKKEIEAFVLALEPEEWSLKSVPEEAKEIGAFGFSQESAVRLGQTRADRESYDVGTLTLYEGGYVDFEVAGLHMTAAVSDGTWEYLSGYFAEE